LTKNQLINRLGIFRYWFPLGPQAIDENEIAIKRWSRVPVIFSQNVLKSINVWAKRFMHINNFCPLSASGFCFLLTHDYAIIKA